MNNNETNENPSEDSSAIPAISPSPDDFDPALSNTDDTANEEQLILDDLKNRAQALGIKFHPSIGVQKLREKIQDALDDTPEDDTEDTGVTEIATPVTGLSSTNTSNSAVARKADQLKLIRVRITCMDPMKKAYEGEIFQTGNALVGTIKRYVPFGVEWHVPNILLKMIRRKQFQQFSEGGKGPLGTPVVQRRMVTAYAVEVLEPLTETELKELAQRQAMARGEATA